MHEVLVVSIPVQATWGGGKGGKCHGKGKMESRYWRRRRGAGAWGEGVYSRSGRGHMQVMK